MTIATVTAIYQGDPDLRDRIRARLDADKRLSQAVLAKESGVSSSVINQWLSGKYPGDNEAVDTKLRLWETADEARREAWELLKGDYLRPEQPTLKACYDRLQRIARVRGWSLPSIRTFQRRVEALHRPRLDCKDHRRKP